MVKRKELSTYLKESFCKYLIYLISYIQLTSLTHRSCFLFQIIINYFPLPWFQIFVQASTSFLKVEGIRDHEENLTFNLCPRPVPTGMITIFSGSLLIFHQNPPQKKKTKRNFNPRIQGYGQKKTPPKKRLKEHELSEFIPSRERSDIPPARKKWKTHLRKCPILG